MTKINLNNAETKNFLALNSRFFYYAAMNFLNHKLKFWFMHLIALECPICGKIYTSRRMMKKHLEKHDPNLRVSDCKRVSIRTGKYIETKFEEE